MWPAAPETLSFQSWGTWKIWKIWKSMTSIDELCFQDFSRTRVCQLLELFGFTVFGSICSMLDVYITHGDPASMCCAFEHFPLLRELAAAACPVLGHSRI